MERYIAQVGSCCVCVGNLERGLRFGKGSKVLSAGKNHQGICLKKDPPPLKNGVSANKGGGAFFKGL